MDVILPLIEGRLFYTHYCLFFVKGHSTKLQIAQFAPIDVLVNDSMLELETCDSSIDL
jgi:hypothetical protein